MPRHTKKENDLGARAIHIAEHQAEEVWRSTGDYEQWSRVFDETFRMSLVEFESLTQN